MNRIYLPTTLDTLASAYLAGGFEPGHAAHTVTATVREWYVDGDLEELEYTAFTEAAAASLHLLAADPPPPASRAADRRVVVAADLDPSVQLLGVTGVIGGDAAGVGAGVRDWRSAVLVGVAVPLSSWVSVHLDALDDDDARAAVAAARAALPAAAGGDDDALFALDEAESHELAWYDITELPDLI